MSASDTPIYVALLDEGVACWRPVRATSLGNLEYRIDPTERIPPDERWQFLPGEAVRCGEKTFQNGRIGMVAVARAAVPAPRSVAIDDASLLNEVREFCARWKVSELSVFGSVIRPDFSPESDVDVLVKFSPDASWSYWEWPDMTGELETMFGRRVDLVEEKYLSNPFVRHRVLASRRVLYAAA